MSYLKDGVLLEDKEEARKLKVSNEVCPYGRGAI